MIKFIAFLTPVALVTLLVLWCTASQAAECERRALANDVAGQYVVECTGSQVTAPSGPARRAVRTLPAVCYHWTTGSRALCGAQRVGVTTVTHMGVRG